VRAAAHDTAFEAEHFRAGSGSAFERYIFKVEGRAPLPRGAARTLCAPSMPISVA
jgi:hypothetical protein